MAKYAVIVKELENGKFMIKFPDFEGITSVAEKEETIEKLAYNVLVGKINELRELEIEVPEPMSVTQVSRMLNSAEGEFTTFIMLDETRMKKPRARGERPSINVNSENVKEQFENVKEISSNLKSTVEEKLRENIKPGQYNLIGIIGGILFAISAFLPIVAMRIPIMGTQRIGLTNFSDIQGLLSGSQFREMKFHIFLIKFLLILILAGGVFAAYSYFVKSKFYSDIATKVNAALFVLFFIYIKIALLKVPAEARSYVGMSYSFLTLLIGIVLIITAYVLLYGKKDEGGF